MATTKTLTPTNQTITIDAFQGEKPDHRHVADAETKLADAVNALNSQLAAKVKAVRQSWGKTLTVPSFGQGILLISYTAAYLVWIQGDTNIRIASLRASGGTKTAADSITFGDDDVSGTGYTITRNGTTLTIESASNNTMSMFYM